jgi:hypothetical protein
VICENPENYPESYRTNTRKEELILTFVANFRRQYHYIYRDRKPLFLNPLNECGVSVNINRKFCFRFLEFFLKFKIETCFYNNSTNLAFIFGIISMECSS